MNTNFRNRVFTPILLPITVLGLLLLVSGSLSRVLLAVDKNVSVIVAVVVAFYVLMMGFIIERNRRITGTALGGGLVFAMIGVLGAGIIGASVGVREIEHHDEEEGAVAEGEGEAGVAIPADALVWEAEAGLAYTAAPDSGTAGEITIAIDNPSGVPHNVAFDGVDGGNAIVEATGGADVATIELGPGTYTYFCTIAGHRSAGMEGTLTLS